MDSTQTDGEPQSPHAYIITALQEGLARLAKEVDRLEGEKLLQRDELCARKAEVSSYQEEIASLNRKVQLLKAQALKDQPARNVGREVRLRFLELHRQRMGTSIGKLGHERIKCGNRAVHRGRPVADALLCLSRLMADEDVYFDLYGLTPAAMKDAMNVPEMVEITGFRASLQSEGKLTSRFQSLFEACLEATQTYSTPVELKTAFQEDKALQRFYHGIQDCYDEIVARKHH